MTLDWDALSVDAIDHGSFFNALFVHRQVFIPYLLAFLLVSITGLRFRIAELQSNDIPPAIDETQTTAATSPAPAWTFLKIAIFPMILGGIYIASMTLPPIGAYALTLMVIIWSSLLAMFLMAVALSTKYPTWAIFRQSSGEACGAVVGSGQVRKRSVLEVLEMLMHLTKFYASSLLMVALMTPHEGNMFEIYLMIAATAVAFVSSSWTKEFSFRRYWKSVPVITLAFLSIAMVSLPSIRDRRDSSEKSNSRGGEYPDIFHDVTAWLLPALVAHLPGALISACLRFDYQVGLAKPLSIPRPLKIAHKDDLAKICHSVKNMVGETGVVLPSYSELPSFGLVYFPAALGLWAAAYGAVLYVGLFFAPSGTAAFEDNSRYSGWACIAGSPLMYAGLCVLAYFRGEWDLFWSYKESHSALDTNKDGAQPGEGDVLLEGMA